MGSDQCFAKNKDINFYDWVKTVSDLCTNNNAATNFQACEAVKFSKKSDVKKWLASEPSRREKAAAAKKRKEEKEKQKRIQEKKLAENAVKYAQDICGEERCAIQNALSVWMNKQVYKTKSGLPSKEENNSEKLIQNPREDYTKQLVNAASPGWLNKIIK